MEPHYGVDISVPTGTPVVSPINGKVDIVTMQVDKSTSQATGWGEYVVISGTDATVLLAHLEAGAQSPDNSLRLKADAPVSQGQLVGYSDATGRVNGPHLHFELIQKGHGYDRKTDPYKVDPMPCLTATDASGTWYYKVVSASGITTAKYNDSNDFGTATDKYDCCSQPSTAPDGSIQIPGSGAILSNNSTQLTAADDSWTDRVLGCSLSNPTQTFPSVIEILTVVQGSTTTSTIHITWIVSDIYVGAEFGNTCPFEATFPGEDGKAEKLLGQDYPVSTFLRKVPFPIRITAHYQDQNWDITWSLQMTLQRVDENGYPPSTSIRCEMAQGAN